MSTVLDFIGRPIGTVWTDITDAERDAGVTPTNHQYEPGDVRRYGAAGDGSTDDSAAMVALGKVIAQGVAPIFDPGATYLISYAGASSASSNDDDYGRKVMYLSGLEDMLIDGRGCTIKCTDHDCANGFMFLWATNSRRITVRGFKFDMTFTGVNETDAKYPFVGAMIFFDEATGSKTQAQLCGDIAVRDCTFKLYHPYGQYALSGTDYGGDTNNGFKVFAVFASGDHLATDYANQNRGFRTENLTFKEGHNGYGVWAWAYNHVAHSGIRAESWVGKYSDEAGAVQGTGVAMLRHILFYCSGVEISGCHFRARPCSDRTDDFEGGAVFAALDANLLGQDLSHGKHIVHGNTIILGNGDGANSCVDYGVAASSYGDFEIVANHFDGIDETDNAESGGYILHNPEATNGNGKSSLLVDSNIFGVHGSYNDNIVLLNGSSTSEYQRRCKALTVTNNISLSQLQYFLNMNGGSAATYLGVRHAVVRGNTIIGTHNTVFDSASGNSRAFLLSANQATDMLDVRDNIVRDKNTFAFASEVHASALASVRGNKLQGVTTEYSGGSLCTQDGYGGALASAATVTLPYDGAIFEISGTTTITSVAASRAGRVVTLIFQDALTFTDGSNLVLAGDFTTTANDSITLLCGGANWLEIARSVN